MNMLFMATLKYESDSYSDYDVQSLHNILLIVSGFTGNCKFVFFAQRPFINDSLRDSMYCGPVS